MEPTFSTVTLATDDAERTEAFLTRGLGLSVHARYGELVYLATGTTRIAIYPREALSAYTGTPFRHPPTGVLLSLNLSTTEAVDELLHRAIAAGARLSRPAGAFEWGGYGACIVDPDGHAWELVHAPR